MLRAFSRLFKNGCILINLHARAHMTAFKLALEAKHERREQNLDLTWNKTAKREKMCLSF